MYFLSSMFPEKVAIQDTDRSLTFSQLHEEINVHSRQLKKLPQGILILEASPTVRFAIQLMAALHINKPVALFSNTLTEQEWDSRVSLLNKAMTVDEMGNLLELYQHNASPYHPQLALILFTSGTTGQVKAVQLSHKNIESNCHAVIKALQFSRVEDQLLFLPLSYSFGLLGQLLPALMAGLSTQLISQFTDIKNILETEQVPQMWSGVPSHWVAISKMTRLYPQSVARIASIVSAGAPLPLSLRTELTTVFRNAIIYNNYGLTEASPRVLTYSSEDVLFSENYAGYPVGDWQLRLSEESELLIQGSQIMLGYLGDEHNEKIDKGWLHTGDIAEILPSGLVAIKGRRDNQVNIGGEKVNLTEIEQKLCLMDGIREVVVLPVTDELYGIRLIACFEQSVIAPQLTEQQLTEKIQLHLLPRKLPISVRLVDHLPRNQHGKLDRTMLKGLLTFQQ
ncbi:class I adenylate-forming enzyme family protein [uncultured Legionella sp.]|uniref:class I adenylate-forming enzyme family protein n=1 Tax=uncultured Legionella sp. TaxID=210934 RepID=UPI002608137A|nr:class I adenylate-forming enzyme family protein [uncultured Legionella sp.]